MSNRKVMLVDDDVSILDALERVLRSENYELIRCERAMEAWDLLNQLKGEVDVIVSDNMMPDADGIVLLKMARRKYPNTVRIMLTGESSAVDAEKAINDAEVYKFLNKPCKVDKFKIVLQEAINYRDFLISQDK